MDRSDAGGSSSSSSKFKMPPDHINAFLRLLGEMRLPQVDRDRAPRRRFAIWRELASRLADEVKVEYDPAKLRDKFYGLEKTYRSTVARGEQNTTAWTYFAPMDKLATMGQDHGTMDSDPLDRWFDDADKEDGEGGEDEEQEQEEVGKLLAQLHKKRWAAERAAWQAKVNTLHQRAITAEAARDQLIKALGDLHGAAAGVGTVPHQAPGLFAGHQGAGAGTVPHLAPGRIAGQDFLLQAPAAEAFPIHGLEASSVFAGAAETAGVGTVNKFLAAPQSPSPVPGLDTENSLMALPAVAGPGPASGDMEDLNWWIQCLENGED